MTNNIDVKGCGSCRGLFYFWTMSFKKLVFSGETAPWVSEIMYSIRNLLLCPPKETGKNLESDFYNFQTDHRYLGLYTSASTGEAKRIWNSTERLFLNARITARAFDISEHDRLLMMAKPWHVVGLSWVLMAESLPDGICNCYGHPPEEFQVTCKGMPANPKSIYLKSPTAIYEGFYDTGDVGYIDQDDRLFLVGRG